MSSPSKKRAAGADPRRAATLTEAMIAVIVAAAVFVPLLSGGVAYWTGARRLEERERALALLGSRLEEVRVVEWDGDAVRPGDYESDTPPSWAPQLLRREGKGSFLLQVRAAPQAYPNAFFGEGVTRRFEDLWVITLVHRWPGGTASIVTVKGGRP